MMPRIQEEYRVSYAAAACIFIVTCTGSMCGIALNVLLNARVGFGKLLVFGLTLIALSHTLQAAASPFPLFVGSYLLYGAGQSLFHVQSNAFIGSMRQGRQARLGMLHACFGLGALSSPLVATQFARMRRWSFHYFISLGLSCGAIIAVSLAFRFKDQLYCLRQIGQEPEQKPEQVPITLRSLVWDNKTLPILTVFLFFYVGTEISMAGWIVTYIMEIREGGPSSGYIASGYFGGLALGRIILIPFTSRVGEELAVVIYTIVAICLQLVVWFVPSLIGNALAVSFIGFCFGPLYPIAVSYASYLIPQHMLAPTLALVCGLGTTGQAIIPFATGAMASRFGIQSMQPLVVSMMACMSVLWCLTVWQARRSRRQVA
ncbi:MFS general substrate transporter [Pterulicium gracile]|uniref:MFS general substrate transporter n=1 Tax=Pterulicium gracile TaxID=1884261 RepID=A0A5C3QN90_9AGAR|nr:MFS general substrate transporter [Pterula gracilis]